LARLAVSPERNGRKKLKALQSNKKRPKFRSLFGDCAHLEQPSPISFSSLWPSHTTHKSRISSTTASEADSSFIIDLKENFALKFPTEKIRYVFRQAAPSYEKLA
jgi:hypothetical protein